MKTAGNTIEVYSVRVGLNHQANEPIINRSCRVGVVGSSPTWSDKTVSQVRRGEGGGSGAKQTPTLALNRPQHWHSTDPTLPLKLEQCCTHNVYKQLYGQKRVN
jgi:hypothetical protein